MKAGVDFRTPLEASVLLKGSVRGYTLRSITYNGEPYSVTVEVFDIDPLIATRRGLQDDLVAAAIGRSRTVPVELGARTVNYFSVSNFVSFLWLQSTSFVIVSTEQIAAGKAEQITEALINANSTESRFFITGQVLSSATGNPIPNVRVWVTHVGRDCCESVVPDVYTGPTGRYEVHVPEGEYRLQFYPRGIDGFGAVWYGGATDYESSQILRVTRNMPSVDARLPIGHVVGGRVTASGLPVKGAHVDAYSATTGGWVTGLDVGDTGAWLLRLAPGKYRIQIWPPDDSTTLQGRWWPNAADIRTSEILLVGESDIHDVDVSLPGGSL